MFRCAPHGKKSGCHYERLEEGSPDARATTGKTAIYEHIRNPATAQTGLGLMGYPVQAMDSDFVF